MESDGSVTPSAIDVREIGAHGMSWQALAAVTVQALQAVVTLTVARAVGPTEFALWGIASLLFNAQHLVGSLGFGPALIYYGSRDDYRDTVDTAFVATLAASGLLCVVAFVAAPAIATVMHQGFASTDVVRVVRLMAIVLLFSTAGQLPQAVIEQKLVFRRRALPEIACVVVYAAMALGLLRAGWSVWSLVAAKVAQSVLLTFLFWAVAPVRPRLPPRLHWSVLCRLVGYGKFISASAILGVVFANADTIAVGVIAGAAPLGAYSLAYSVTTLAPTFLTATIGKVFFPLFAAIRDDDPALCDAFASALHFIGIVMLPATFGLLVVAPDALKGIFGAQWALAGPLLRILALYGALRTLLLVTNIAASATGRPEVLLGVEVIAVAVALALLWPLATWGASGVAWAFTLAQGTAATYGVWKTRRFWTRRAVRPLLAPAAAAVVTTCAAVIALSLGTGASQGWMALVTFVVGYPLVVASLDRRIGETVALLFRRQALVDSYVR
jgi:O-antigen/teichoic acid export membrane protein